RKIDAGLRPVAVLGPPHRQAERGLETRDLLRGEPSMKMLLAAGLALAVISCTPQAFSRGEDNKKGDGAEPMISHNVFFALKDNSAPARQKLVEACRKYLKDHPGE